MKPRLARRPLRVEPLHCTYPDYVQTYGPEVADICALANYAPDPEQEMLLDLLFAIRPDGRSAVFEFDLIGPRQNLKTAFIKMAELGWLYVTEERLVVHSAHELDTTAEAFLELSTLIEDTPALSRRLAPTRGDRPGISEGNGRWLILLRTGQRMKYKARTKGGGRGLTGNKVVLDEAFALTASHMGSLLPTLAAVPDPQVLSASSGGLPKSAVLRDKRDRGRVAKSSRQAYVEWGDRRAGEGCARLDCDHAKTAVGCVLDDEQRWAEIMPALGTRVQVETIRSMRQAMPPEEFAREFMVWWDEPEDETAETLFDPDVWQSLEGADDGRLSPLAFGVSVSPDRDRAWIGVAGRRDDGRIQVELAEARRGVRWPVTWLAGLPLDQRPSAMMLDGTAKSMAADLVTAGVDEQLVHTTNAAERAQAGAAFYDLFGAGGLRHPGEPLLDRAIAAAAKREIYDGFVFEGPPAVIGPLAAVSLAVRGVMVHGQNKPPPADPRRLPPIATKTADLATVGF